MKDNDSAVSPVLGVMLMIVVTVIIAAVVSAVAADLGSEKKAGPNVSLGWQLKYSATGVPVSSEAVTVTITYMRPDGTTRTETRQVGRWTGSRGSGTPGMGLNKDGLVFTHQGGDPIDLKDLQIDVGGGDLHTILDYGNTKSGVPAVGMTAGQISGGTSPDVVTDISASGSWGNYTAADIQSLIPNKYFYKIGPDGLDMGDTIIRPGDSFIWLVDNNNWGTVSGSYGQPQRVATYWSIKTVNAYGGDESQGIERGSDQGWILSHKPSGEILAKGTFEYPDT